jgi:hypothetical protein
MASLQSRSGSWRVIFRFRGIQHFVTVGDVERTEAEGVKSRYEYLLRLLKQRLLSMPAGMDVYQVQVTVTGGGNTLNTTVPVEVTRPPAFMVVANVAASSGTTLTSSVLALFFEPDGADSPSEFSGSVNWGDGTSGTATIEEIGTNTGLFEVVGSHTYSTSPRHPLSISVSQNWDDNFLMSKGSAQGSPVGLGDPDDDPDPDFTEYMSYVVKASLCSYYKCFELTDAFFEWQGTLDDIAFERVAQRDVGDVVSELQALAKLLLVQTTDGKGLGENGTDPLLDIYFRYENKSVRYYPDACGNFGEDSDGRATLGLYPDFFDEFFYETIFVGFHLGAITADLSWDIGLNAKGDGYLATKDLSEDAKVLTEYLGDTGKKNIKSEIQLLVGGIQQNGAAFHAYYQRYGEWWKDAFPHGPPNYLYYQEINYDDYSNVADGLSSEGLNYFDGAWWMQ